jgi:TetR/AcrR family transcriptional repressor of nem operon
MESTTKQKAIHEARTLLQRLGFNGFSFQHIADALKIKKPSLYAHFESKEDLGNELIQHYSRSFQTWADGISELEPRSKLMAFFDLFFKFSKADALYCPISALTADLNTLPASMRKNLKALVELETEWLKQTILSGQTEGTFRKDLKTAELVQFIITLSIGSQFMGRIHGDPEIIKSIKHQALFFLEESHVRKSKI